MDGESLPQMKLLPGAHRSSSAGQPGTSTLWPGVWGQLAQKIGLTNISSTQESALLYPLTEFTSSDA